MRTWQTLAMVLGSLLVVALLVPGSAAATTKRTQRVSVGPAGVQGNFPSELPSVSANGRYVAFDSAASNLVSGDTNGYADVFVRDRKLHKTFLVSVSSTGSQGNDYSFNPSISANGRYVAFESAATNLVSGDTNGYQDVFVRDRKLHKTYLVSVSSAGLQGNSASYDPSISADGRYVAFDSEAGNLVSAATDDRDVFVRDLKLHRTSMVSVSSAGIQGNDISALPAISADGRYVAFESVATNLVSGDTNGYADVFVRDRKLHRTSLASVTSAGAQGNGPSYTPSISGSGRYVAFESDATDLVSGDSNASRDIFVRDRTLHRTTRVSVSSAGVQSNGTSFQSAISASGRFVAFASAATDLVSGDSNGFIDVFVRDRTLHKTARASVTTAGVQGNEQSDSPAISADGSYVAFDSLASDLVAGDSSIYQDVFIRGPYR